jgi:hypothetical protein
MLRYREENQPFYSVPIELVTTGSTFFENRKLNMKARFLSRVLLSLAVLLTACTTNPLKLQPVTINDKLTIASPFEFTVDRSSIACKYLYKYVLAAGDYSAKFQDQEGVYFVGQFRNVREQALVASCGNGVLISVEWEGGFYLPNDKTKAAKIFYLLKTRQASNQNSSNSQLLGDVRQQLYRAIADVAAASEEGNLWFPPQPTEPSLRNAINR